MSGIDYVLIIAIVAVLAVSFALAKVRKKKGKGCCGGISCDYCSKKCDEIR